MAKRKVINPDDVIQHLSPVWRDRADYILMADIAEGAIPKKWEQLWARRLADDTFEICCVPFAVYDVALGDVVEADDDSIVTRVVKASGRYTFRAWFGDLHDTEVLKRTRRQVLDEVKLRMGCLVEWHSELLLAIDAKSDQEARQVADYLSAVQEAGKLSYETGRTR